MSSSIVNLQTQVIAVLGFFFLLSIWLWR